MIKCDGFLKLLKLSCFGLLTSFFTFFVGSSVSALGATTTIGLVSSPSAVDSNYDITFLKGGGLLTSYLGVSKGILALRNNVLFWWTPNGLPYGYLHGDTNGRTDQGFFDGYYSCDELTGAGGPNNCTLGDNINLSGDNGTTIEIFKAFFSKVYADDYVYYDYYDHRYIGATSNGVSNYIKVCFSSHEIGKTLCFFGGYCGGVDRCPDGRFTSSQNYQDLKFSNIPYGSIGYAPGQNGYGGQYDGSAGGSQGTDINNSITGSYVTANCTWNDIVIALESEGYNRYLCYGGLDNFDLFDSSLNYNPVPGFGKSISEIWAYSSSRAWDNFTEFFTFWNGLYTDTTDNNYTAMWESYPAVYRTYFQLYNTYQNGAVDPRALLEYCQIKAFSGFDLNNTVTNSYFKPSCEKIIQEKQTGIWDKRVNGDLYSGGVYTGNVPISVNWDGVGNISGNSTYTDGTTFLQDFFNSARKVVPTNYSGDLFGGGFLPKYIVMFLCAIILFRFIRH